MGQGCRAELPCAGAFSIVALQLPAERHAIRPAWGPLCRRNTPCPGILLACASSERQRGWIVR